METVMPGESLEEGKESFQVNPGGVSGRGAEGTARAQETEAGGSEWARLGAARPADLRRVRPGVSGNPTGRREIIAKCGLHPEVIGNHCELANQVQLAF